jgi:hypothetical protein
MFSMLPVFTFENRESPRKSDRSLLPQGFVRTNGTSPKQCFVEKLSAHAQSGWALSTHGYMSRGIDDAPPLLRDP